MAIFSALGSIALKAGSAFNKKKEKPKKSGKEMGSAIVKRDESRPVAKTKVVSVTKLLNLKPVMDAKDKKLSTKSSGVSSIDKVLDDIDNTLFGIINSVGDASKLRKKNLSQEKRETTRKEKKRREGVLEKPKTLIGKLTSAVSSPAKGIADVIGKFFKNVFLGSLVMFIVNNWTTILGWFQKAYETIKNFWESLKKPMKWTWDAMKWIVGAGGGQKLIEDGEEQLAILNSDKKKLDDESKKIEKNINELEKVNKDFDGNKGFGGEDGGTGGGDINDKSTIFGGEKGDGFLGPKWLRIPNPFSEKSEKEPDMVGEREREGTFSDVKAEPNMGTWTGDGWQKEFKGTAGFQHPDLSFDMDNRRSKTVAAISDKTSYETASNNTIIMMGNNKGSGTPSGGGTKTILVPYSVNNNVNPLQVKLAKA